jgi:hypothetical protein
MVPKALSQWVTGRFSFSTVTIDLPTLATARVQGEFCHMLRLATFRRTLSLLLTVALLSNQALALTAAGFIGVWEGEQQRLSFWWQTSGWAKTLTALPLRLTGQTQSSGRPETQADRDARVHTLKIQPDNVTAQPGQQVILQAVAYDFNGNAIPGVKFEWSANDEGRKQPATVTPQGEFRALVDGTYKVTAHALGRQTQVIVKVVGEAFKARKPEEIPTDKVSTRDLPPAKSDTSLNRSRYQQSQITGTTAQPTARGTLMGRGKPALKATTGALTTTAAFQLWGDPYGWTDQNYTTSDDCGKEVGDPPGRLVDNGAGSGNHQFTAPILNLEGRNLDLGLALSYNGRVWHKANNEITFDIDRDWPAPGFSLGFGKITQTGLSHGFMLIDGDGTRHGYQCQYNATGMTCYTNDGSFVDYDVVTSSSPVANTPISATAKMADGTIITYGAPATYAVYPTKIMDRHGNYLTITYVNDQGPRINQITDTLGRVVTFHYDAANCLTAITAPDFSTGAARTLVRLNYFDLTLSHNYTSNPVPKVRASSFKMLKAIYYPATATGYWFGGSGDYSGYGMLTKVCEQRGMVFDNNTALTSPGTITAGTMSHEMSYVYNAPSTIEPMYTEMREKWFGMETGAGTPGYDATTGSAKTTFQIVEEPAQSRRYTRIVRPDGTIHVQWQYANPGQFNDGLIFYDKTCAPGATCLFDAVGTADSPGLRGSSVSWETGSNGAPRPWAVFNYYRPWQNLAGQASNSKLTRLYYGSWNNQVTTTDEYDYAGTLIRTSTTQYETASYYLDRHIFNLPKIVEVKEGSVVKQKTEYVYDNGALLSNASNVIQHDANYDPQNIYYDPMTDFRGLVTQVKRYPTIGSSTGMVTETHTYDETGNLLTAATSCCEQTTFSYSSNNQYAYPMIQTRGSASDPNTQITTSAVYDMYTGLVTQATDANGRLSKSFYAQSSGVTPGTLRLRRQEAPTGAMIEYAYNDTNLTVSATTYASFSGSSGGTGGGTGVGSQNLKTLDGVGRVCNEIAYGAAMVQDKVDTKYDGLGRVWKQTRPYRTGDTPQWY